VWVVIEIEDVVHVVPEDDLKEHDLSASCECSPKCEEGGTCDDAVHWMVTHHSYDRREENE
jgi:hypothetical protein